MARTSVPSLGRVQIASLRDFSGGLNLSDDQFNLAPNESPDLTNVNLLPRGGVELRNGVNKYGGTGLNATSTTIHRPFAVAEGLGASGAGTSKYVFLFETTAAPARTIWYTTGAGTNWTSLSTYPTVSTKMRACVAASAETRITKIYFQNFTDAPRTWDATTFATLVDPAVAAVTYNDNLASPDQGQMPKAKVLCMYAGSMWVGNLREDTTNHPSRLRFSHPNEPEDWRTLDYIDVDPGVGGDQITALVPLQDRLLIFKSRSIYVLSGYDANTFQLMPFNQEVGAVSQEMVSATEHGVFFYDATQGMHLLHLDGQVEYLFDKIRPAIDDGTILTTSALTDYGSVLYSNQKVYVSVPWGTGVTYSTKILVLDLLLGENGGWTVYDIASYGGVVQRAQETDDSVIYGGFNNAATRQFRLDQQQAHDLWDGSTTTHIDSYFVTAWWDAGVPAVQKRFRRPTYLIQNAATGVLTWFSYEDFDPSNLAKSGEIQMEGTGTVMIYGPTGSTLIGASVWAGPNLNRATPKKGGTLGNAYAVQIKMVGPVELIHWGLNQISYRFIMKRVR